MTKQEAVTESGKGTAPTPKSRVQLAAIVVLAVIVLAGIALWVYQVSGNYWQTNMRDLDSWGLYLINFMWFVGLSAGGLIISSMPRAFGLKGYGDISKVAVWVSLAAIIAAAAFVVVDLGSPWRIWELIVYANFTSPLFWDVLAISGYAIVSIVYLVLYLRADKGKVNEKAMRVIAVVALAVAILVHSVTAWIFGLLQGHEFWYTALLAPWFVSSALVSGLALVLIVVAVLNKTSYLTVTHDNFVRLVRLLGVFTVVDLYFYACDMLTAGFPGAHNLGLAVVQMLTTGTLAPFFWLEIVLSALVIGIAFVPALRRMGAIVFASSCAVLAIFFKRVQLLIGGFQQPNIDLPTSVTSLPLSEGGELTQGMNWGLVYFPSPLELGVVVGVLALFGLILLVGLRVMKLGDR
ncbi:MAG: polysulfide reductase NrfD [Coriobacteriales bacterium]|jgi:molybdopterin-containing oxidoreductase family membrane subunit|nr:polysulfide reductase NrfD [Coriobacteriales bacterium]